MKVNFREMNYRRERIKLFRNSNPEQGGVCSFGGFLFEIFGKLFFILQIVGACHCTVALVDEEKRYLCELRIIGRQLLLPGYNETRLFNAPCQFIVVTIGEFSIREWVVLIILFRYE